jgi:hypothetical protein
MLLEALPHPALARTAVTSGQKHTLAAPNILAMEHIHIQNRPSPLNPTPLAGRGGEATCSRKNEFVSIDASVFQMTTRRFRYPILSHSHIGGSIREEQRKSNSFHIQHRPKQQQQEGKQTGPRSNGGQHD